MIAWDGEQGAACREPTRRQSERQAVRDDDDPI